MITFSSSTLRPSWLLYESMVLIGRSGFLGDIGGLSLSGNGGRVSLRSMTLDRSNRLFVSLFKYRTKI